MRLSAQIELLDYRRASGFQTFIVSDGGVDLMRTFAEEIYGIPPSHGVGSSAQVTYSLVDGVPTLTKEAKIGSIDDKEGKPTSIHLHVGRQPILAFGNSDGDQAMLQFTTGADRRRLGLILDHDDAQREYDYQAGPAGRLETDLAEADANGWIAVSMKDDWQRIFPGAE